MGLNAQLSIMMSSFGTSSFLLIGGAVITVGGKGVEKGKPRGTSTRSTSTGTLRPNFAPCRKLMMTSRTAVLNAPFDQVWAAFDDPAVGIATGRR